MMGLDGPLGQSLVLRSEVWLFGNEIGADENQEASQPIRLERPNEVRTGH